MNIRPETSIDGYKTGHRLQVPIGMELTFANFTPRKSYRKQKVDEVVFFGLQYFIKEYLIKQWNENFFSQPKDKVLARFARRINNYLGPNNVGIDHIESLHDLGYLPITIMALKEGSKVPYKVAPMIIFTNDKRFHWLATYLETITSTTIWPLSTTATTSKQFRDLSEKYAMETVGDTGFCKYQNHNFSYRGCMGHEAAVMVDAGFLTSSVGSDTIPGIDFMEEYYNADSDKELVSCSVAALEHSTVCAYGKENEFEAIRRNIQDVYPNGIVSVISDSFDYWKVLTEYVTALKDIIMARDGKVVFRPDCYSSDTQIMTKNGWKFFYDLREEDFVAQILDDETIEFVKPIKYFEDDYEGEMYHFKNFHGSLDLLVTPNHRMIYKKKNDWFVQLAETCPIEGYYQKDILRSAKYPDQNKHLTWFERFLIAFQADGSFDDLDRKEPGKLSGKRTLEFNFQKKRKIDRLRNILQNGGFTYKENKIPSRAGQSTFTVQVSHEDFRKISKTFDWVNLSNLCSTWCSEFIEEMRHWDGHIRSETRIKYDSTIKENLDVVERVSIAAGKGVLISRYEDDRKEHFSDIYTAHILDNNRIGGQAIEKEKVEYNGKIYCVQVPSGRILVKRNRGIAVCGNSGDNVKTIIGDPDAPEGSPQRKGTIELLYEIFGGTVSKNGYKILDSHVGAIIGDGVTLDVEQRIFEGLKAKGFASINCVMGIGSFSLVYAVSRDSDGWAEKSTYCEISGVPRSIFKDPKTDTGGLKKSAKGLIAVYMGADGKYFQRDEVTWNEVNNCAYELVFKNSQLYRDEKLNDIRLLINPNF